MLQNIWYNFKIVRMIKRGVWIKTKRRGWIELDTYNDYISYGFNPILIKTESYE